MAARTFAVLGFAAALAGAGAAHARSVERAVRSPDARVRFELLAPAAATHARLRYRVSLGDRTIVAASGLGLEFADGAQLGRDCDVVDATTVAIDSSFEQFPGKRRQVREQATETTFTLRERGTAPREWQLVVRAYDDGIALRYRIPAAPGRATLELAADRTEFVFSDDARVTRLPLAGYTTSHENRYANTRISDIPPGELNGLPMLVRLPGAGSAAILEANLTDWAGMYLARSAEHRGGVIARLAPRRDDPRIAVRSSLPRDSPWRVILVAAHAERLLESDTLLTLNAPSVITDTSWIHPGKTTFPWWNDFYESGLPFKLGLDTRTAQYYIDFCAEYGIPYHSLDGVNDTAWYGGPIGYAGAGITEGIAGLDLPAVADYARTKGVRLRLWMHWRAAERHMADAFPRYAALGIEGVMIDFMDRDDQEMVNFQRRLLQLAADHHLTVNFHGVAAPTGLERTFPNLLNSEAVRNLEYDKWDPAGVTPAHDVTVPLTRMLAGPVDYHQGTLRGVPAERFTARVAAPLVIGTPVRMLATYVVLQNHLPMMADYPSAYRAHPLTRVMSAIPATWDDTRALVAEAGARVAIARRSGASWWIGAMTDERPREFALPLSFLPSGDYVAQIYRDDLPAADGFALETRRVTQADTLRLRTAAAGGALVRLEPAAGQ